MIAMMNYWISFPRILLAKRLPAQRRLVGVRYSHEASCSNRTENTTKTTKNKTLFLHIAPCGDWWTGHEIYAAKHLQPDYVRSVEIPPSFDPEQLTDKQRMGIYDTGSFPNEHDGLKMKE
mmetsp:Transcript_17560/g.27350  ORF Transcript_17560/g.27350 Transcript_17560/m.27350 type:complete len:120 (-) Transcript_17560:1007-1366(-)